MPLTFTQADAGYRKVIEATGRELPSAFSAARAVKRANLSAKDLSQALLLRLKSFFLAQDRIKNELCKGCAAPAADFFVETVCFFLAVALEKLDPSLKVKSERAISRRRGAIRPDISIWREDSIVAAIECKTQLGWKRSKWSSDFKKRQARLARTFPRAKLFLLVMTSSNWPGFGGDQKVGRQYFVLLKDKWPREFEASTFKTSVIHPIEELIRAVLAHTNK